MTDPSQPELLDDEEIRSALVDPVAAPPSRDADLLPFGSRSWPDFERMVLRIVEELDGLSEARIYGVPGQRQNGIDIYGVLRSRERVGYQVKRYQDFSAADLRRAVTAFADGVRPVNATRFVVCTSAAAQRTEILETLEELRAASDFEIGLYDACEMSAKLRQRPDLVRRLFGGAWEEAFCGGQPWEVPSEAPIDQLVDSLARGPVAALGLEQRLLAVDSHGVANPFEAAQELGAIVDALATAGYGAAGDGLQLRRADLLLASGDVAGATQLLVELEWGAIERGEVYWDRRPEMALGRIQASHPSSGAGCFAEFFEVCHQWFGHPSGDVGVLIDRAANVLELQPPIADRLVLWLVETAHANSDSVSSVRLRPALDACISTHESRPKSEPIPVRCRLARAESDGVWDDLLRDARLGRLGHAMAALVHARAARFFARAGAPEDAEAEYQQANQRACLGGLFAEAAAIARSLAHLRNLYGPLVDVDPLLQFASAVEQREAKGHFSGRDPLRAAYGALAAERLPEALRWLRSALHRASVRGDLGQEIAAQQAMWALLLRSGEPGLATRHAVSGRVADATKKLDSLAHYVDMRPMAQGAPHWERAIALELAAHQWDLIPDLEVSDYAVIAERGIEERPRGAIGPHVRDAAWKVLARLSRRLDVSALEGAVELLDKWAQKEESSSLPGGEEAMRLLRWMLSDDGNCDRRLVRIAERLLEKGGIGADSAVRALILVEPYPSAFVDMLSVRAESGCVHSCELLAGEHLRTDASVAWVEERIGRRLDLPVEGDGLNGIGLGLSMLAHEAKIASPDSQVRLASRCFAIATNRQAVESNRIEGALALASLADALPEHTRRDALAEMLKLSSEDFEPTMIDEFHRSSMHPLSAFRFDLGDGSIKGAALRSAAALASGEDEVTEVIRAAIPYLMQASNIADDAAVAVSNLPVRLLSADARALSKHGSATVRQLAAMVAVDQGVQALDVLRELARDSGVAVRRLVAGYVTQIAALDSQTSDQIRRTLSDDPNWSVRASCGAQ